MKYLITKYVTDQATMEAFEGRVNEYLSSGWHLDEVHFEDMATGVACRAVVCIADEIWAKVKK